MTECKDELVTNYIVAEKLTSISCSWLKGTPIKADEAMLKVQKILDRLEDTGQL
jgi:hypothetical protein